MKFSQVFLKSRSRQSSGERHHRLGFTASTHLPFKEKSVLREPGEPRQHHELQSRHTPGSPLWEDGSSSLPASQPGLNLDQLSFFQINQLQNPGAAESPGTPCSCCTELRQLLSREAAVCSFIWEGKCLRTGQGWQNPALNQALMALAAKPHSAQELLCTSSLSRHKDFPKARTTLAAFPSTAGTARSVCGELLLLDNAQIFPTSSAHWDTVARLSS